MSLKEEIHQVAHWHSQILEFSSEKDFMDYFNEFVAEYFKALSTLDKTIFKIEAEEYQLTISILKYKFIARIESPHIVFYKRFSYREVIKIGSYRRVTGPHTLFDMTLDKFHPEYLEMLLEDAFSDIKNIHSQIVQKQYWL